MQPEQPANPPQQPAEPGEHDVMQVELEHNIPIKQPDQPALAANTAVAPAKQFVEVGAKSDKHLENVLKDASREVKDMARAPAKKTRFSLKVLFAKKKQPTTPAAATAPVAAKPQSLTAPKASRPFVVIAAAFVIAVALVAAAIYTFRQSQSTASKASNKAQTVGSSPNTNASVQPADISGLSSDLQTKIDQLNDDQDFNVNDLADQTLGL